MSLTSTSTTAEVEAQYDDNASYREDGDVGKAKLFAQACRMLLRRYPASVQQEGASFSRSTYLIQSELDNVTAWLEANNPPQGGGLTIPNFESARD